MEIAKRLKYRTQNRLHYVIMLSGDIEKGILILKSTVKIIQQKYSEILYLSILYSVNFIKIIFYTKSCLKNLREK